MWKIDRERKKNNEHKVFDKLLSENESETLEFKKSTGEWREIIETISAFANSPRWIFLSILNLCKKQLTINFVCWFYPTG